jgi:hypothetical protein
MKTSDQPPSPDGFLYFSDSSYATEHARLDEYLRDPAASALPAESAKLQKQDQLTLLCASLERLEFQRLKGSINSGLSTLLKKLAGRKLPYTEEGLIWCLISAANILSPRPAGSDPLSELDSPIPGVVPALLDGVETVSKDKPLSREMLDALHRLHAPLKPLEFWAGNRKTVQRIETLLKQTQMPDEGEPWAEAIRKDISAMAPSRRNAWLALLENVPKGTTAKPTQTWRKRADALLGAIGPEEFARQTEHWFSLVGKKAIEKIQPRNATLLRSLVWYASLLSGDTVCRALSNAIEGGLRKVDTGGLYASSISKACIAALEAMPGLEPVAQLSRLKYRVKSPWGLQEVEKAFEKAVTRSGISREEIEEIALPKFGLGKNGTLRRPVGDGSFEIAIVGSREVEVRWFDAAGARLKKAPAEYASEAKSAKQLAGDIHKMLVAQHDRLEDFLQRDRVQRFDAWKAHYLEHPLMAALSRRLIWHFREGKLSSAGLWREGGFVDSNDLALEWITPRTEVRLWHPLGVQAPEVQSWRVYLEQNSLTQPFKQAHREIYILTSAEQATRTYSNRFAGHILRQHQFKALCEQRGWRYDFLGSWDQPQSAATRDLAGWDLRAEFWIDHAGGGCAPSGVSLHVATDQVRFRRSSQETIDLTEVPALVFSEIMRDVDLFVSVCTLGNDPAWTDSGEQQQRDYWREWAFGELNETAATRHDFLTRLLPKLKIGNRCSLEKRYLVVQGQLHAYRIHLGSGNVLMSPNDEYLCIVPNRLKTPIETERLCLPFEGDSMLSIILSKAFLLADDHKITDPSITKQIGA